MLSRPIVCPLAWSETPQTVTAQVADIPSGAFASIASLLSVEIPSSVTTIAADAFTGSGTNGFQKLNQKCIENLRLPHSTLLELK